MEVTIDHVVSILKAGQAADRSCSLLIGAGCSFTAEIPTAAGFVKIIEDEFKPYFELAESKTYPACMATLPPGIRRDLIAKYVDNAKINWAHVAIAQLLAHGWVDRILTTNFDPLVVRACSLIGLHPAIYDFAASQLLKPEQVPQQAVFHLHGQRAGFVLMNTEDDCREHSERLGPLFNDAGVGRTWIVVGYSGDNDPVFDHLAGVRCFDYGLYWVGYKDSEPAKHLREKLLVPGKNASYLRGHDADSFFVELAQKLECFPPRFVEEPFSHIESLFSNLAEFKLDRGGTKIDVMATPRRLIEQAKALYETSADADTSKLESAALPLFMAGEYEQAAAILQTVSDLSEAGMDNLIWSYIGHGNLLGDQAKTKSGTEADRLFEATGQKYQQALDIKPDKHEALYNWGITLGDQAKTKSGEEADRLFEAAGQKYQQALDIKPDKHEALNNWGTALGAQAKTKSGAEADRLFEAAGQKYQQALDIKPDMHEALNNWGSFLLRQAHMKTGSNRTRLLNRALDVLERAERLGSKEVLYNLACAHTRLGDEQKAEHYLRAAKQHGTLPDRAHIESDHDFDAVRDQAWFKDLLDELLPRDQEGDSDTA